MTLMFFWLTPNALLISSAALWETVIILSHPVGDKSLHQERIIEDPSHLDIEVRGILEPGGAVYGQGMVYRRDEGNAKSLDQEKTVPEALVVMDDVKLVRLQQLLEFEKCTEREGFDLREYAELCRNELVEIQRLERRERLVGLDKILRLVEIIMVADAVDGDALLLKRIGRPGDDVHFMAELHQLPRYVHDIYALAAAVRISPVAEKTYFHCFLLYCIDYILINIKSILRRHRPGKIIHGPLSSVLTHARPGFSILQNLHDRIAQRPGISGLHQDPA